MADLEPLDRLKPFQRRLLDVAYSGDYRILAWSMPRGAGKSYLAARFIRDLIDPTSKHYVGPGREVVMMAASQKQARVLWTYLCRWLDDGVTFKSGKATNNLCVHNPATETGAWIYSSNAKTTFGLVGVPWVIADEPGAWEVAGGKMMQDAIETSMGKLGSSLRVLYIGTRAPAKHGWWIDLLDGGTPKAAPSSATSIATVNDGMTGNTSARSTRSCAPMPRAVRSCVTSVTKPARTPASRPASCRTALCSFTPVGGPPRPTKSEPGNHGSKHNDETISGFIAFIPVNADTNENTFLPDFWSSFANYIFQKSEYPNNLLKNAKYQSIYCF